MSQQIATHHQSDRVMKVQQKMKAHQTHHQEKERPQKPFHRTLIHSVITTGEQGNGKGLRSSRWRVLILIVLGIGLVLVCMNNLTTGSVAKQEQLRECALASGTVAAAEGKMPS